MTRYRYTARGMDGNRISGTLDAATRQEAIAQLHGRNLIVSELDEDKGGVAGAVKGAGRLSRATVKTMDMVVFTRQVATMIGAGIPLLEALDIMTEQVEDEGFRRVLATVADDVRSGNDLSTSLSRFPRIFPAIYVNMVRAGEASGQLDIILVRLAEYQEANARLVREIKSAMTYPAIAMILVLGITTFLMVYIVPKFKDIFDSLDMELPLITKIVLGLSMAIKNHFVLIILVIIGLIILGTIYVRRTKAGRRQWDKFKLWVPIFGPLFRKVALSRFARTFSTLIRSGVPMLGALEIVAGTAGNVLIAEAIDNARESIRQGENLSDPLAESDLFPPMVTRMISVGEKSGALEQLLEKISEFYDEQVEATVDALTSLIEPILIAIMGLVVGTIVLSIFLPIIKIQATLAGG